MGRKLDTCMAKSRFELRTHCFRKPFRTCIQIAESLPCGTVFQVERSQDEVLGTWPCYAMRAPDSFGLLAPDRRLLYALYVGHHDGQRCVGEGDRQQVGAMNQGPAAAPRRACERGVVGDAHGVDSGSQRGQAPQVQRVQPGHRAQRQADTVQTDGPALACRLKHGQRGAAVTKEVLGVKLVEGQRWRRRQQRLVVRLAQADAGISGHVR